MAVAGWTISAALVSILAGTEAGLFWARSAFFTAGLSVFALMLFFHTFPFQNTLPRSRSVHTFAIWAAIMAVLSLSPWVVTAITVTPRGFVATYGPLYPVFAAYVISCVGYSLVLIVRKTQVARGAEHQQLIYLFVALIAPGLAATVTNLIIPLTTGSSELSRYGPMFSVVMIGMIAHAIIRHRLMDIRLVIRRGVVYLIAATIAGAVFASILAVVAAQSSGHFQKVPLSLQVAVALSIALAFNPLKRWLQARLDKYVYRESYDYQRIIRDASRTISATLDLNSILKYLCDTTSRTLRPDFVAVFTRDARNEAFRPTAVSAFASIANVSDQTHLPSSSALPTFLVKSGGALLSDEVGRTVMGKDAEAAAAHLSSLRGEIAVPMLSENRLIGFLVVGPKLSGDAYFRDDVELLSTLSNQAATAVNNAQLYGQVLLANEYIENILRTMDSGVITVDGVGKVQLSNSTAEQLIGLSRSTLTSRTVDELPPSLGAQLTATLTDGHPRLQIETTLPDGAQRLIPIVCSTSALRDSRRTILGALVVFSDLSKLKALESEKRRAERLAAFGTLVSGIAHEIKNPLVAIKTFAELLPERFTEADFREDFAKVVITEIDRIDDLVARLRGLAVPSPQPVGPVDIREPITETLALLRWQLEHSRTILHREFEDSAPYVAVDSAQLKQLFLNLFINAIEAMGVGGELTIRIGRRTTTTGAWVVADVSDTGPGIPESIRSNIFDPFFTTKPRGSGLGLAICRGITDAHRGTIRAETTNTGAGTTIVVEFPATVATAKLTEENVLRS